MELLQTPRLKTCQERGADTVAVALGREITVAFTTDYYGFVAVRFSSLQKKRLPRFEISASFLVGLNVDLEKKSLF